MGGLYPAALALLLAGLWGLAGETVLALRRHRTVPPVAALDHPAAKGFWILAVVLAGYFAWLQPYFLNFDEYSSWGTAAKLMTQNNQLYTLCETGLPWQMTELPALPLLSYFFQLFGEFAPWRAIFAADAAMLGACAAVAGCAGKARVSLPVFMAALLVPILLSVAGHTALLSTAWLEFLGNMPAGMLFGGVVLVPAVSEILAVKNTALDLVWHGFAQPKWFPYRESFLLVFWLLTLGQGRWSRP